MCVRFVGHVGFDKKGAGSLGDFLAKAAPPTAEGHGRSLLREAFDDAMTDPACASGNKSNFSFEPFCHISLAVLGLLDCEMQHALPADGAAPYIPARFSLPRKPVCDDRV
jgi:hypothetical protein